MKYAVQMGLGAMIYIPSFIKIGSDIQKLIKVGWEINRNIARKFHKYIIIFSKSGK
jgi:hypothetical protein